MPDPSIPAGQRGTFVPDSGAPVRGVVIVSHADGRLVLEILPNHSTVTWAGGIVPVTTPGTAVPCPRVPPERVPE